MTRTLVDKALALADKYDREGNIVKRDYFLKLAEEAETVYDEIELDRQKGDDRYV